MFFKNIYYFGLLKRKILKKIVMICVIIFVDKIFLQKNLFMNEYVEYD